MRVLRNIFTQLHEYVLWLLLSAVLWGWIFSTFLTDTKPEKKVVLYVDAVQCDDTGLSEALEEHMPAGIRMIKVHPYSYALFDTAALENADLYIFPASRAEEYWESFAPLTGLGGEAGQLRWEKDGVPYGIRIYDAAKRRGGAMDYITYASSEGPPEDYYLFFGVNGLHAAALTGKGDEAALETGRTLLAMTGEASREGADDPDMKSELILGMDASCVPALERSGVIYTDFDGQPQDVFKTLSECGISHIRVRIWNDPFDEAGHGYGGGNCDIENALEIGRRAARYGMKLIVDFHYSDFWADPSKQMTPKAWRGMTAAEKADALRAFTEDCLIRLLDAGAEVGMVQLGNEINGGLCGETDWENITMLLRAGSEAVRKVCPNALAAVHFTNPENRGSYDSFAGILSEHGVDYDVFASSYYPFWHGTLDSLAKELSRVSETFGKKVMVMETSYPYTAEDTDFFPNTVSGSPEPSGHPYTVQGQTAQVLDVAQSVIAGTSGGIGVVYWEGTWISVGGSSRAENSELWERCGSGWASSFAASYDPKDAGRYYGGCAVDNQAMFDPEGHPLDSLKAFLLVRDGYYP